MTKKELPKFLQEAQQKMMMEMREKGYSLKNIADIFNTSKMVVYRLTGETRKVDQENKQNG